MNEAAVFARMFDRQMSKAERRPHCTRKRNPHAKRRRGLCKTLQASYSAFFERFNLVDCARSLSSCE